MLKVSDVSYDGNVWTIPLHQVSDNVKQLPNIDIPISITSLADYACYGCESVSSIIIPSSVKQIGLAGFAECKSLVSVDLPTSITHLLNDTFYNCTSLSTLNITTYLKQIDSTAFLNCKNLKTIYVKCDRYADFVNYVKMMGDNEHNYKWKYVSSKGWSNTFDFGGIADFDKCEWLVIPDGITHLKCQNAKCLRYIDNTATIKSLAQSCFKGCDNLESYHSYCNIPAHCFEGCSHLMRAVIEHDVGDRQYMPSADKVGEYAFNNCAALTSIQFMNEAHIKSHAFSNCVRLCSVDLSKVVEIDESAFEGCELLNTLTFPDVSQIPNKCFKGCFELTSLTFSDACRKISVSAFEDCKKLRDVDLRFVKVIDDYAFNNCFALSQITQQQELKRIGKSSFANCIGLKNLDIGAVKIETSAFEWCTSLEYANINHLKHIEYGVFAHNIHLNDVKLQGYITKFGLPFTDTPMLTNVAITSDNTRLKDVERVMKTTTIPHVCVEMSTKARGMLDEVEQNKLTISTLGETLDDKLYTHPTDIIVKIQQRCINNKTRLIDIKNTLLAKMKTLSNTPDIDNVHTMTLTVKTELEEAVKRYQKERKRIDEMIATGVVDDV